MTLQRVPTAILHIGCEKTGSTAIQTHLAAHRSELAERGVIYPDFDHRDPHPELVAYAANDEKRDHLRIGLGIGSDAELQAFRRDLERRLADQVDASGASCLVCSCEHMQSRLTTKAELLRLRDLLATVADSVRVIVYLRRQDRLAVSRYAEIVRYGSTMTGIFDQPTRQEYWHFDALLDRWTDVFGATAVTPRIYEAERLAGGCVVRDFFETAGLGDVPGSVERSNTSLSPLAVAFLRSFNAHVPFMVDRRINRDHQPMREALSNLFPGKGLRPSRVDAEAFYRRFEAQNERLRARWFKERASVFSEDFDDYPEEADSDSFDFEDAVTVAAALWKTLCPIYRERKERIEQLEAELAQLSDQAR